MADESPIRKRPRSKRLQQAPSYGFRARETTIVKRNRARVGAHGIRSAITARLEEALSQLHTAKLTSSGYAQFQCLQNIERHLNALMEDTVERQEASTTERGLG